MTRPAVAFLKTVATLVLLIAAGHAYAHRQSSPGNLSGIAIPSISHGEMAVLAEYRRDILRIAGQVKQTDPTYRALLNHSAIQYSYCMWGIGPGSISDEDSPFNECAHAYLAAAKALLFHLRGMKGTVEQANSLIAQIDAEVVRKGAAFIGCSYSGEFFNTAEFITPHWENLTTHRPSLLAIGGALVVLVSPVLLRLLFSALASRRLAASRK